MLENIFQPMQIGSLELKNRFIVSPMETNYCTAEGEVTETFIAYHEAKAKGGWGLIVTEDYAVDPLGKAFPYVPGLWSDEHIQGNKNLTERVHKAGGRIFTQLYHCGRSTTKEIIGTDPVGPSPIACAPNSGPTRELTTEEVGGLIEKFGDSARRAMNAGFDGIEIHGAHGYLIAQLMSPYTNKRIDKYGGGTIGRMRFPLEIIGNIRKKCGAAFPIQFRISGEELAIGGREIEDTKVMARMLEEHGIDSLNISVGASGSKRNSVVPSMVSHGWIADYAAEIKKVVKIPVIVAGRITEAMLADTIITSGKADAVAMGRASLADPELPNKAKSGNFENIVHCIGCMLGCAVRNCQFLPVRCVLNPRIGREKEYTITSCDRKKKVLIAGGGPSGMEAAIVAARRGHDVTLYEKRDRLGGQYYLAAVPPWKGEISDFLAWQVRTMEAEGVKVVTGTELTRGYVETENPDVLILATGSISKLPPVPGIDQSFVMTANEALEGKKDVGRNIAVIGGGLVGSETAHHFAVHGKKVTIIELLPEIAKEEPDVIKGFLLKSLEEYGTEIYTDTAVQKIDAQGNIHVKKDDRPVMLGKFDTVIISTGMQSVKTMQDAADLPVDEIHVIGDADETGQVIKAIDDGYRVALKL